MVSYGSTASQATPSYLILGAGVFGASTALHLIQKHPDASVTLVDRKQGSCEVGASWDWNKVVRADYEDTFYMSLALEALDLWKDDQLYSQFFHQSGVAWLMPDPEYPKRLANNYRKSGRELDFEIIRPEELRERYLGLFDETDFRGVGDIFLNRSSGWAEAKAAVNAVIDCAVKAGVRNVALDVVSLILDKSGVCTGLQGKNGETLRADRIILCTGAYTAKLMADSAPGRKDIQVDHRLTAAAVIEGIFRLDPARVEKFKNGPVFVHNVGEVMGEQSVSTIKLRKLTILQVRQCHPPRMVS
jgi:sarcosine oxidase/L-pipecolate oxidase